MGKHCKVLSDIGPKTEDKPTAGPGTPPPAAKTSTLEKPEAKKRKKSGPSKRELEGQEQAELLEWFRLQYPEIGHLLIHIPNGGSRRNAFEGWRLKQQGVRAGVSDLLLPVARGGYHGLWLEFKAAPPNDAAVSASQAEWLAWMQAQGYRAEICLGVAAAMTVFNTYLASPLDADNQKEGNSMASDAAIAAIQFALITEEGLAFLDCWNHGDFDSIRREWPDAPEAVFRGADPLFEPRMPPAPGAEATP